LHAGAYAVAVVLGFNDGKRNVRFVGQDVISAFEFTPSMQLPAHDNAPLGEAYFLTNLAVQIPPGSGDGRGDVFGADVALGELFLVGHRAEIFRYNEYA
jgi:hypothetical protein